MKPVMLIILDGWGHREAREGNAVALAQTPVFDRLWATCPRTLLRTSGLDVGLPDGVMGNSEVGHLNIGAGRVVYQDLTRINESIRQVEFAANASLTAACALVQRTGATLHLMGLLSNGSVHSHIDHLLALLTTTRAVGVTNIRLHLFLDGRDTPPQSGVGFLQQLQAYLTDHRHPARIASVSGRYYAMDRDKRWERTKLAYDAIVHGVGPRVTDPLAMLHDSYREGVTDEFVLPTVVVADGQPVGPIRDGDVVLAINFRADRMRQLTRALACEDFQDFDRGAYIRLGQYLCMTSYHQDFRFPLLFPPQSMSNLCGELVAARGLRQLRIAETEKYAHVTFFFNGGEERLYPGEDRVLVPSPRDVPTYDHKPEMSAREVTAAVCQRITDDAYDFIVLNFANPDMVGHTGVLAAAIRAVETTDACLGQVLEALLARGGAAIVTADHGNCEQMIMSDGTPHTSHTTNLVPCCLVQPPSAACTLRDGGRLADLAPTLLELMGILRPSEMTGRSLIVAG
ncbi:MAG: 2,3-bisphosphoglycerate-independent phosphoglycerate mutase [Deltaproteobacteria bacterium]|nr:2,3-bisphosphoglycerate-independent phosphoglycerate mutase [Deltaproteobacteria bacterium]